MKNSFLKATMDYPYRDKAMKLIRDTPVEVAIGAVLVSAILGGVSYKIENEKQIPIAFSEIGKTIKSFEREGKIVPPLTLHYAKLNDFFMTFFEAVNSAREINDSHSRLAGEIDAKLNLPFHHKVEEYVQELPGHAHEALKSVDKLTMAEKDLPDVITALDQAWDDEHHDVTHTETKCDIDGKNCHSESVYDYTIHKYKYYPQQGEKADRLIKSFLRNHPDLQVEEKLILATETDPENAYAIERSMSKDLKGKIPTPEQELKYANKAMTGSNFATYQPVIAYRHQALSQIAPAWHQALRTAHSVRYKTYSRRDDGPHEFQVAEKALEHAQTIYASSRAITDGIRQTDYYVPTLEKAMKEYVSVVLDGKPGNPDKLKTEMMDAAAKGYKSNFKNGLDVDPFKWGNVAMGVGLGLLLGGLAGYGVDYYGNRRRNYFPHV